MTSYALPAVYRCPSCAGVFLQARLRSFNTYGAQYWSDGYASYLSSAVHWPMACCPTCRTVLWHADLAPIGVLPRKPYMPPETNWLMRYLIEREHGDQRIQREWDAAPADWRAAEYGDRPDYTDLCAALAAICPSDSEKEIAIRRRIWWQSGHHLRDGADQKAAVPVDAAHQNMLRLIDLIGAKAGSAVERPELLRQLARFDDAVVTANLVSGSALAGKIMMWARKGDAELKQVASM